MQHGNLCRRHRVLGLALGLCGALACAVPAARSQPAAATMPPGHPAGAPKQAAPAVPVKRIDINSAGAAELKTIAGIGDAEAKKIIAGRPWLTKIDLVNKGVLPEGVYVAVRDRIVALQPTKKDSGK
jgi:DNA uptake protein ComE-like DNA-binding protein